MTPIKAYEVLTAICRYTLTIYRTEDGRYLGEYCAHHDQPGPLVRVGDINPPPSSLVDHQAFYVQTLLSNCLAEISRDAGGAVNMVTEIPVQHSEPGHECKDEVRA